MGSRGALPPAARGRTVRLVLAQPAPALTSGPALLIDNMLRAAGVIVLVGFAVFVAADGRVAARAAVVVSLLCLVLGASVLFSGIWSPFRDRWAMAAAAVVTAASALNIYRRRDVWTRIQGISTKVIVGAGRLRLNYWTETFDLRREAEQHRLALRGHVRRPDLDSGRPRGRAGTALPCAPSCGRTAGGAAARSAVPPDGARAGGAPGTPE